MLTIIYVDELARRSDLDEVCLEDPNRQANQASASQPHHREPELPITTHVIDIHVVFVTSLCVLRIGGNPHLVSGRDFDLDKEAMT
jgi:hypothetical protein